MLDNMPKKSMQNLTKEVNVKAKMERKEENNIA